MSLKILWAEYFNNSPVSGIAHDKEGKEIYFKRKDSLGFVSSIEELDLPPTVSEEIRPMFLLYKINSEQSSRLTQEHDDICDKTGSPKRHGDPRIFYLNPIHQKQELQNFQTNPDGTTTGILKTISNKSEVNYNISVDGLRGEYLGIVDENSFENYNVEYTCEFH